jgi:hypothetical protein
MRRVVLAIVTLQLVFQRSVLGKEYWLFSFYSLARVL